MGHGRLQRERHLMQEYGVRSMAAAQNFHFGSGKNGPDLC